MKKLIILIFISLSLWANCAEIFKNSYQLLTNEEIFSHIDTWLDEKQEKGAYLPGLLPEIRVKDHEAFMHPDLFYHVWGNISFPVKAYEELIELDTLNRNEYLAALSFLIDDYYLLEEFKKRVGFL